MNKAESTLANFCQT